MHGCTFSKYNDHKICRRSHKTNAKKLHLDPSYWKKKSILRPIFVPFPALESKETRTNYDKSRFEIIFTGFWHKMLSGEVYYDQTAFLINEVLIDGWYHLLVDKQLPFGAILIYFLFICVYSLSCWNMIPDFNTCVSLKFCCIISLFFVQFLHDVILKHFVDVFYLLVQVFSFNFDMVGN